MINKCLAWFSRVRRRLRSGPLTPPWLFPPNHNISNEPGMDFQVSVEIGWYETLKLLPFPVKRNQIEFCPALGMTKHHFPMAIDGLSLNTMSSCSSSAGECWCLRLLNGSLAVMKEVTVTEKHLVLLQTRFEDWLDKNDFEYSDLLSDVMWRSIVWPRQWVSISWHCCLHWSTLSTNTL